ncbi:hypothetical protein M422DRAFT_263987 [Sphaerobolus stellatus SS14]|uniref:Enoyl reductase (ER) domain-containing protein n=1 Tax=Sphaerobolus stellatus (strain SS14) TaxID=990650 RepID=A0A0C9UGV5_SPHS4|nr:hypothetical protein M422DRAFT_263987 [Sphaerobolus stellatus SS14]
MAIPETIRAVVIKEAGVAPVTEIPTPKLEDNEVLVQVKAVAQNPTDWKHRDGFANPGTILGCDFSGIVAAVGPSVTTSVKVGDQVAGFVQGGHFKDRGAFAEYLKTPADLVWVVPKGTLSHEEAATLGCGFWTAVQALFHPTRLGLTEPPAKVEGEKWVFVYGGSSSVGLFAIQLLAAAGYKVATVSSPRNFELVKSLGATVVFDYKSPDVLDQIIAATTPSGGIIGALDTQGASEGQLLAVKAFGPEGKGKVVTILGPKDEAVAYNPNVTIQPTLIYTALGREFSFGEVFPVSKEDRDHMAAFLTKVPELVKSGAIKPNRVKLWEGGLDGIEGGLAYMKEGKLSAEKLVYKI